jgi:hypothetical protein
MPLLPLLLTLILSLSSPVWADERITWQENTTITTDDVAGSYQQIEYQLSNPLHFWPQPDGTWTGWFEQQTDDIENPTSTIHPLDGLAITGSRFSSKRFSGQFAILSLPAGEGLFISAPGLRLESGTPPVLYRKDDVSALSPSFLREKNRPLDRYWPPNLLDGNEATAWAEGAAGPGIGVRIRLLFAKPQIVRSLTITNGYAKNPRVFSASGRVKTLAVLTPAGEVTSLALADLATPQTLPVNITAPTPWIDLEIRDVFPGSKFQDTCLSEIEIDPIPGNEENP